MTRQITEPLKASKRKQIIDDVLAKHGIEPEEFFSKRRTDDLVDARREAASRLLAADFSLMRVAQILKRNRTTIEYYVSGQRWARGCKRQRARAWRLLYMLPNEDRETIEKLAAEKNVSPYHLTRKWLMERAQAENARLAA